MNDTRLDVIFHVDTGCAKSLLVNGHNCIVGYDKDGFGEELLDRMSAQGLLDIDETGWVRVTKPGWDFWKLHLDKFELSVTES